MIAKPERARRRARRVALQAARAVGCCCNPDVVVYAGANAARVACVFHDSWCPVTRSHEGNGTPPSNVVLYPREGDS
jgi:hypothetical protein